MLHRFQVVQHSAPVPVPVLQCLSVRSTAPLFVCRLFGGGSLGWRNVSVSQPAAPQGAGAGTARSSQSHVPTDRHAVFSSGYSMPSSAQLRTWPCTHQCAEGLRHGTHTMWRRFLSNSRCLESMLSQMFCGMSGISVGSRLLGRKRLAATRRPTGPAPLDLPPSSARSDVRDQKGRAQLRSFPSAPAKHSEHLGVGGGGAVGLHCHTSVPLHAPSER